MTRLVRNGVLFLLAGVVSAPLLWGQVYQQLPVDEAAGGEQSALFQSLRSGAGEAGQVDSFLKNFYLARWTVPDNFRQLHTLRAELLSEGLAMSGAGRTTFFTAALAQLSEMAKNGALAPSVRYNAVLTIASMNESENEQTQVPYGPAVPALVNLATAAGNQPDYIVLGALLGLARQAAFGIPDVGNRKAAVDIFLEILEPSFAQKRNFDAEMAVWLQCRAVEGLAAFKSVSGYGEGTRILDTFRRLIEEPKTDLSILDEALTGLGGINLADAADYDYAALARSLAKCSRTLMEKETSYIETESLRDQLGTGSMGAARSMGGMGEMGGSESGGMNAMPRRQTSGAVPGRTSDATSGDTAQLESVMAQIAIDLDSIQAAIRGENGQGGVMAVLKEDDTESKAILDDTLARIEKTRLFLTYGEMSLEDDFNPKLVRLPVARRGVKNFMVDITGIKEYLNDQILATRDLSPAPGGRRE